MFLIKTVVQTGFHKQISSQGNKVMEHETCIIVYSRVGKQRYNYLTCPNAIMCLHKFGQKYKQIIKL